MKISTLHDLYVEELRDIYDAEKQLTVLMPQLSKAATYEDLKETFDEHSEEVKEQVERLGKMFEGLGLEPKGKKCRAMEGLAAETKELIDGDIEPEALDAGLILCAQKIKHYEIASYGSLCAFAKLLGYEEEADQLEEILDQEKEADEALTDLAEGTVNGEAAEVEEHEEAPKPRGKK